MSPYNDFAGVVFLAPHVPVGTIRAAIARAIGDAACRRFFDSAIEPGKAFLPHCLDFSAIPPEGADLDMVERAMAALIPFVDLDPTDPQDTLEIAMVPGLHWTDARLYRFIRAGHAIVLERSHASLQSNGDWRAIRTGTPVHTTSRCSEDSSHA